MVAEAHTFLGDFAQACQTPYLKTATVCQHGAIPTGKAVQSAEIANGLVARSQAQVVGVAQNNLSSKCFQILGVRGLNRALCTHGHENGGRYLAVRQVQGAQACAAGVSFVQGETHELRTNLAAKMGLPMASHCC